MKYLGIALLVAASLVLAQRPTPEDRINKAQRSTLLIDNSIGTRSMTGMDVRYSADSVKQEGGVVRLEGHVRLTSPSFRLTADRAEYRRGSGMIDAHGDVHVQLIPVLPDR